MTHGDEDRRKRLVEQWITELVTRFDSKAELARQLGVNTSTVTRWTQGGSMDLDNLVKVAKLSGQSLGDMMIAFYGVTQDQLIPTAPEARLTRLIDEDGQMMLRDGRYRLVMLLPEEA